MVRTGRVVDFVVSAEARETHRATGKKLLRELDRVDHLAVVADFAAPAALQLSVKKARVERSVVDDQRAAVHKREELIDDLGEFRLVREELVRDAVDFDGVRRDFTLRVDVELKAVFRAVREESTVERDAADLDDAVAALSFEACRFGVERDETLRSHEDLGGSVAVSAS